MLLPPRQSRQSEGPWQATRTPHSRFAASVWTPSSSLWCQPDAGTYSVASAGCEAWVRPSTVPSASESQAHRISERFTCNSRAFLFSGFGCSRCTICLGVPIFVSFEFSILLYKLDSSNRINCNNSYLALFCPQQVWNIKNLHKRLLHPYIHRVQSLHNHKLIIRAWEIMERGTHIAETNPFRLTLMVLLGKWGDIIILEELVITAKYARSRNR